MRDRPSQIPHDALPGARNRYDDFVGTHINSTYRVHVDGIFLAWHRHLLYLFEQELREHCGYQYYLMYWNWPLYPDMASSTLFDGSDTSLGGNGEFDASNPNPTNGNYTPPQGNGGGCVVTGPFANTTLHFRNFPASLLAPGETLPEDSLEYNEHCLRRNLNSDILNASNNQTNIDRLLREPEIVSFQRRIDSTFHPFGQNIPDYGIHAGPHAGVGGEMGDFMASPSDPVWWLHHSMVDNVWSNWQARDPPTRQYAINGTNMIYNINGTMVTAEYLVHFGYLAEPMRLWDLMDIQSGAYCYRYEY
jgi:tyrosinase